MTLTDYGVELRVELGIGRQGDAAVWDRGTWDAAAVWGQPATALGDWVEVTCETADPFTLTAGASDADGVVTRWEAATCSLKLVGSQWDPWGGPWAGVVGPMVAVRVSWRKPAGTWVPAFTGAVTPDGWDWVPGKQPYVQVAATDSTQVLAAFDPVEQTPQGIGDTAAQRVSRILDLAAWPVTLRDITPGGVKLKSSTMAEVAWTQLLAVADTDLALMWVRRDGRLSFRPEGRVGVGVDLKAKLVICPPAPPAPNVGPVARFTHSELDQTTTVNGSTSSDPDGTIVSYAWQFGDGGTGTGVTATHTYTAGGTFTVRLTVTDDDGATGTVTHPVTVASPPITPASLSGVFWVAAEDCGPGGTAVATWVDRKGVNNVTADGPTPYVSGLPGDVTPIGGSVVRLQDSPMHAPTVHMAGSGELWAVVKANAGDAPAWSYGSFNDSCYYPFQDGKHYEHFGSAGARYSYTPTLTPLGSWRLLRMALDDTAHTLTIWLDGVQQFQATGVTTGWAANLMVFGAWKGCAAEVFLRPVVSTPAEATGLQNYFWGKHHVGAAIATERAAPEPFDELTEIQVVTIGGAQFADIRNQVSVSRQKEEGGPDGLTVTVRDDASAARYLRRAYSRTDLQHQADSWSTTVANAILASSAWPSRAPREAVLSSMLGDSNVAPMLLSLEPDSTFDVEDTAGEIWREGCVGWAVTVGRHRIDGTIQLVDMSKWVGAKWQTALWDTDRWSYAVTIPGLEEE